MMRYRCGLLLGLAAVACMAWAADVTGPVTGYLFDTQTRAVRPVLGIPGASTLGAPLALGFDVALAAVAPAQDYLIATGADGQTRVVRLGSGGLAGIALETLHGAPERVVFSPRGSAAALVAGDKLDVVTGLPGAPVMARTLELSSTPRALAVSDDGAAVLAVMEGAVAAAGEAAEWHRLASPEAASAVAFEASSHKGVAAGAGPVVVYLDVAASAEATTIGSDRLQQAAGLAMAGSRVWVADRGAKAVLSIDLASGGVNGIVCDVAPEQLTAMGSLFRVNELGANPVWLVDASAEQPRMVFVPMPVASQ